MSKSIAEFIKEMKSITARTESSILSAVGVVDTKIDVANARIDKIAEYISDENKSIMQRLAKIEEHITQPSQKCEAPKAVNTIQYNNAAQNVEAIGTCKVWNKESKSWESVNFFGFCSTCGDPILSPSVIAYCTVNKLTLNCYPCQKGKTRTAKYMDITLVNGIEPQHHKPVDTTIVAKCDICGKPRKYKSSDDYLAKKKYAESLGLKGTMCTVCAKKALDQLSQESQAPKYEDPIVLEEKIYEDKHRVRVLEESIQDNGKYTMNAVVEFLLTHGQEESDILAMKISELRRICEGYAIPLPFDGNEWNRSKVSVIEAVEKELVARGRELDEMMYPESNNKPDSKVIDAEFTEEINQGF